MWKLCVEWMYPQDGSGNAGPPDQSCPHGGVDTEAQRAEGVLDGFLLDVGGDRLALGGDAPGSCPITAEGQRAGASWSAGANLVPCG